MPNLVAYDLAGVQPMNGPTGLIFAMRSRFNNSVWYRSTIQRTRFSILRSGPDGFDVTNGFTNGNVGLGTTAQKKLGDGGTIRR